MGGICLARREVNALAVDRIEYLACRAVVWCERAFAVALPLLPDTLAFQSAVGILATAALGAQALGKPGLT